jgi:ribokinase
VVSGTVAVVGSANVDLTVEVGRLPAPGETVAATGYRTALGGKGLNQAVTAARQGADVRFAGCVGTDPEGDAVAAALTAEGIDTRLLHRRPDLPTGRAFVTVDAAGANTIAVVPGANAAVDVEAALVEGAAVVLAQLEVPTDAVAAALRLGRAAGAVTLLNPAPAVPLDPELLALVDILVPNETEWAVLGRSGGGATRVVVTEGAAGALVIEPTNTWRLPPVTPPGRVVDPTGAGDAFCGALAAGLAAGLPLEAALRRAAAAGALAVTVAGALPSLPTAADVDALVAASAGGNDR